MGPVASLTVAEFLAWESRQQNRHEYSNGRVAAATGGTVAHSVIVARLTIALSGATEDLVLGGDMTIETARSARHADVVVTGDPRDRDWNARSVRYPRAIVEVMTDASATYDRMEKLDEYLAIPSLLEYVIVDSRKRWAQRLRSSEHGWIIGLPISSGELEFASVGLALAIDHLYRDIAVERA
jgi:Uma2 family endonuclease